MQQFRNKHIKNQKQILFIHITNSNKTSDQIEADPFEQFNRKSIKTGNPDQFLSKSEIIIKKSE
jgi:ABC-type transporter lipoprotein component MlaA